MIEERGQTVAEPSTGEWAKRSRSGVLRRFAMRWRKVVVRTHRWLAIGLLAWITVMALTGAWLVEHNTFERWLEPGRYEATPGDIGVDAAVESVIAAAPEGSLVTYVAYPWNGGGVYRAEVEIEDPEAPEGYDYIEYWIDPGSGRINASSSYYSGFTWWMYRGHLYLWQDHGIFGVFDEDDGWCRLDIEGNEPGGLRGAVCDVIPTGDQMVAWFGVGMIVVILSGFYLWYWPGVHRWATAVVLKRGKGRFAFNMSLHKVIGFVVWVPLLVIAFTGMAFSFPRVVDWYDTLTPAQSGFDLWVFPEELVSSEPVGREPIGFAAAVAAIDATFPDRKVEGLSPPWDETGYYAAWVTRGFSPWTSEYGAGNTYVAVDQYSGKVIADLTPEQGNVFDQLWDDYSYPLHTGEFGGQATSFIWFFVALAPLALGITGVTMNLIRRSKRRARATT